MIAQQYLGYIEAMEDLNLNVAGEFLVMAATLLQIKSKMLLPVDETAEDEEDGPDPREELVRRLLEYKAFKEAARQLDTQERMWRGNFKRDTSRDETGFRQGRSNMGAHGGFVFFDAISWGFWCDAL